MAVLPEFFLPKILDSMVICGLEGRNAERLRGDGWKGRVWMCDGGPTRGKKAQEINIKIRVGTDEHCWRFNGRPRRKASR